ncbi:acyltransferase [Erythrobacter sp. SD-21]|uniref:acyltransferase family protein n=1 Tax=Erythrobacter sp. SD-21 TaxID=161528 RepID=UPI0002F7BD6B|nr:acyltransferase [Erythrobacter sp. SD-21]
MSNSGGNINRLHGLDALRGLAAIIVVLYHMNWSKTGLFAVDLFFLLSGYILTRTYEARISTLGALGFMRRRYKRLIFPFFIGCLVGGAYLLTKEPTLQVFAAFALAMLFLPNPFFTHAFAVNGPGWSLFFELAANLLHVLVLGKMSTRTLVWLWLVLLAAWFYMVATIGIEAGVYFDRFPATMLRTLVPYIQGILLYRLWGERTLSISPLLGVALLPVAIMVGGTFPHFAILVLFPLVVILSLKEMPKGFVQPAVILGGMSYPLYVLHRPLMNWTDLNMGAAIAFVWAFLWALGTPAKVVWGFLARPSRNAVKDTGAIKGQAETG